MEKMWFSEEEIRLYKLYKELEKEVDKEVRNQIRKLEKILPEKFRTIKNEDEYYSSWWYIWNIGKLIEYQLTWNSKVFQREKEEKDKNEINMFETIIIDRSWSMWKFENKDSPLREAVKASIIRAKVLEHFKVNFSIIIFDTELEEVMNFNEKFSNKWKNNIPSKLMRAVMKSWWTDIWKPLTHALSSMDKYYRMNWLESFWNISILCDWEPTNWLTWNWLKDLVEEIRKSRFWLTAYYINWSKQNMNWLENYFWRGESWGTVLVSNVEDLTEKLISSYTKNLKNVIKK